MKTKSISKYSIILVLVLLFHIGNNIYFLYQDNMPLIWDAYNYHRISVNNYNEFKQGNLSGLSDQYLLFPDSPLVFYTSFLIYPIFGQSQDVSAFQGTIFLVILIIATYLLGKELFSNEVGLLSAVLISFSPLILAISKIPYEDIVFVAMFTLTLYFFVKSKKFSDIRYIWRFNISLGLTLLSRFNAFIILLFIIITYVILKLLFDRKDFKNYFLKSNRRNIIHFIASFFVSMILPAIFYANYMQTLIDITYAAFNVQKLNLFNLSNLLPAFVNYLKTYVLSFEYPFIFLGILVAVILFLIYSKKNRLLIISLILGSSLYQFIILYLLYVPIIRMPRYIVFMKPLYFIIFSLLLIFYLYNLLSNLAKKINIKIMSREVYSKLIIMASIIILIPLTLIFNYTPSFQEPSDISSSYGKYHISEINYDIEGLLNNMKINMKMKDDENKSIFFLQPVNSYVMVFNSHVFYNYPNLNIVNTWLRDGFEFKDKYNNPLNINDFITNNSFIAAKLITFDYVFVPEKITKDYSELYLASEQVLGYLQQNPDRFRLFKKIEIDDFNTTLLIYENLKNEK